MPAGIFNLTDSNAIEQNSDFYFTITYQTSAGVPINLSTITPIGQIKNNWSDTVPLATFTITVLTPASSGVVGISLPAALSASITPGTYLYDIKFSDSSNGSVYHVLKGACQITQTVTR
jgi:hypothetical protein